MKQIKTQGLYRKKDVVDILGAVDLCSTYINQPTLVATS